MLAHRTHTHTHTHTHLLPSERYKCSKITQRKTERKLNVIFLKQTCYNVTDSYRESITWPQRQNVDINKIHSDLLGKFHNIQFLDGYNNADIR